MTYPEQQARLAEYQAQEERQRRGYALNHKWPCVPWRGSGGELGRCIYCGKSQNHNTAAWAVPRHHQRATYE